MKDTERRRYEMLVRVRDFGDAHAASFPAASRGGELLTTLGQIVEDLGAHAAQQSASATAATALAASRSAARETLWDELEAISRTAGAFDPERPDLTERFQLPRRNRNDQVLLATARAFLAEARPLKAEFVRYELPANFIERLEAHLAAFDESVTEQNLRAQSRVAATSSIGETIERGVALVRQLDAIVKNKFRDDPAELAAWESASRTERAPRRAKPAAGDPQPPK